MKHSQKLNFLRKYWAKYGRQMGFFPFALGKQNRGKHQQTDNYIGISSLCWPGSFKHRLLGETHWNWKPDIFHTKVTTKRQPTVKEHCITAHLHCASKPTVLTQVYSLHLKPSSRGVLGQTDITLCSVAGEHLVGQWLISSSFSPEVSQPVRSTVKLSAVQSTGRWVIQER